MKKEQEIETQPTTNAPHLGIQMKAMEVTDFEIKSKRAIQQDQLAFGIELSHTISTDGKIQVDIQVSINHEDRADLLCSINVSYSFILINYQEWLDFNNSKSPVMPSDYANLMNGIAISTLRGILFMKLQGTFLEGVCLPIIDLSGLQVQQN